MPDIAKDPNVPASEVDQLMTRILRLLPSAQFSDDNDGQIVIYTGVRSGPNGTVVSVDQD